ncbi:helix-turn-helix transcriptional regulator [Ferrimonas balearica]|uniref:helix-turn-helix transcriptional regulator n=1 Tax=Ferrimonas balearica TaxID=44012 RepID=UPI001C9901AF|nr:metalloregulator ArsR/SmtB family transcription factor [Ferrimonas balearica]MBY5993950.1 transcriptional regulator [Ferrimonas balearica]
MSSAASKILFLLKQRGPSPLAPLAEALALTTMGVRQHLQKLEQRGLVQFEDRRQGPGRPSRHWFLSDAGHREFGDRHQDLTLQLLESVQDLFGDAGLDRLIQHRSESQKTLYSQTLSDCESLSQRVERLAELRHQEGYMARVLPQEEGWLLVEDHCPICAAARHCQGLCRQELELFQGLLAPEAEVTRTEHLLGGASRCAYRITPAKAAS